MAMVGAPLPASSGRATRQAARDKRGLNGPKARPSMNSATANNCTSSGVVSWPSCSKPSDAINASSAPSAMARA